MPFLRKKREEPRVELTPMVDVVFLLLIFFMISTTFIETPGIDIKLPESSAETVQKEPKEVKVFVSKAGEVFLNKEPVSLEALEGRLRKLRGSGEDTTFLLLADREAQHGRVVQVMDIARSAGFERLAIATERGNP